MEVNTSSCGGWKRKRVNSVGWYMGRAIKIVVPVVSIFASGGSDASNINYEREKHWRRELQDAVHFQFCFGVVSIYVSFPLDSSIAFTFYFTNCN